MVIVEPSEEHKIKDEADVWVVTRGGIYTRIDLEKGE
jgi:hypothetical protein